MSFNLNPLPVSPPLPVLLVHRHSSFICLSSALSPSAAKFSPQQPHCCPLIGGLHFYQITCKQHPTLLFHPAELGPYLTLTPALCSSQIILCFSGKKNPSFLGLQLTKSDKRGGLELQEFIVSQVWRPETGDEAVARVTLPLKPLGRDLPCMFLLASGFLLSVLGIPCRRIT